MPIEPNEGGTEHGEQLQIGATLATAGACEGFTLDMLKAVISGRGDEVVNLAKTICGANEDWPWPHTAS
jgi:hypothetical protein